VTARVDAGERTLLRRLDHVAIAVRDKDKALAYFSQTLGLALIHTDELEKPPVTLLYLNAGNILIQLLSPRADCDLSRWLDEHGDGLHHVCFAVDDVAAAINALSDPSAPPPDLGSGRGRISAFVQGDNPAGVLIECTEFHAADGAARSGDG
jgi:methylmalonyl-CoA/ethylmalonyl-CoA epimerase